MENLSWCFGSVKNHLTFIFLSCVAHNIEEWPTLKEEKSLKVFYVLHLKANNSVEIYNNAWSFIMFNLRFVVNKENDATRETIAWYHKEFIIFLYSRIFAKNGEVRRKPDQWKKLCKRPRNWVCFCNSYNRARPVARAHEKCGARKM